MYKGELSIPEAAQRLNVSQPTITKMIERGDLQIAREEQRGRQRRVFVTQASVEARMPGKDTSG